MADDYENGSSSSDPCLFDDWGNIPNESRADSEPKESSEPLPPPITPFSAFPDDGETRPPSEPLARWPTPDPQSPHVIIWGTPMSGKTTFMAALFHVLMYSKWVMVPVTGEARDWIDIIYNNLIDNGVFPPDTREGQEKFPIFSIRERGGGQKALFQFTFPDVPGKFYEDPQGYSRRMNLPDPYQYLRTCSGIVMLIDPLNAIRRSPQRELSSVINTLNALLDDSQGRHRGYVDIPIAFCLTKCDEPECRAAIIETGDAKGFAASVFGDVMGRFAEGVCQTAEWFACSSIGYPIGTKAPTNTYIRWNYQKGIRDPRQNLQPINVAQPLEWLLNNMRLPQP